MRLTACLWLPALLFALLACVPQTAAAQTREWRQMHQGNKAFRAEKYDKSAAHYMEALRNNPTGSRALFNLADTYLAKGDVRAADSLFAAAAQYETNASVRSMAFHNRGYICQKAAGKDSQHRQEMLRQAIEMYKQALRLNPHADDSRYNLALCQKQLKDEKNKNNQDKQKQQQQQQQQKQQPDKQPQGGKDGQDNKQQKKDEQLPQQQAEQYLNMSQQAEKRALQRIRQGQPRRRSLEKNW